MTDQNLAKDLLQYTEWSGSRADLMALIERLEKAEPRARMLQSKKAPYPLLPINARRIQWFITKGMMPKPFGHKYGYMHLVYYWASIVARKREKLPFDQIQGLSNAINLDIAQNYIGKNSALLGLMKANDANEQNFSDASFQEQSKMKPWTRGRAAVKIGVAPFRNYAVVSCDDKQKPKIQNRPQKHRRVD